MPITRSITHQRAVGDEWEISGVLNLGTYVAGGVSFKPKDFGYTTLRDIQHQAIALDTGGVPIWLAIDWSQKKILAFNRLGTELADATSLLGCPVTYTSLGVI